jgi:hypothetical protein
MATPKMSAAGEKTKARTGKAANVRSSTGSNQGAALFVALRKILRAHEAALVVARDVPGDYELTERASGVSGAAGVSGKPRFFGGVRTSRSHTTFLLAPLAGNAALVDAMSEHLRARMEGNASFQFKTIEPGLFEELAALTASCLAALPAAG